MDSFGEQVMSLNGGGIGRLIRLLHLVLGETGAWLGGDILVDVLGDDKGRPPRLVRTSPGGSV